MTNDNLKQADIVERPRMSSVTQPIPIIMRDQSEMPFTFDRVISIT